MAGTAWIVRLRRDDKAVVVGIGQIRAGADRLAEQLTDLRALPDPGDLDRRASCRVNRESRGHEHLLSSCRPDSLTSTIGSNIVTVGRR